MHCHKPTSFTPNVHADQPPQRQHRAGQERVAAHSNARWPLRKQHALCGCSSAQRHVRERVQRGGTGAAIHCLCAVHTREAAAGRLRWRAPAGRPGDATQSHHHGATDENLNVKQLNRHQHGYHSSLGFSTYL